jgi:3-oxoacyl-[acyl-carrier protein] reductase
MELSKKIALVTGAGQGIGKAVAMALAKEGALVAANDRDLAMAKDTAAEIQAGGQIAMAVQADVSDSEHVRAMVDQVVEKWGGIDILVNNAGAIQAVMVEDLAKKDWDRVIDINLGGVFNCSKAVIPAMKPRGAGRIINIASLAAKTMSYVGGADYTASKAGVLGFTRHLAFELGPWRITVNAVCPGLVMTPLTTHRFTPEKKEAVKLRTPLRDLVTTEDVAAAVVFLASEKARMITGTSLDVDGGISLGIQDWEAYVQTRKPYVP